jgi:predicted nucleotidyltransferase
MTVAYIDIPEPLVAELCRRNGIRKRALLRSRSADRFCESSNVDVLMAFHPGERIGFLKLADIGDERNHLLGVHKVDRLDTI